MRGKRGHLLLIAGVSLAMFVPYGVTGPAFFVDDWWTLRNGAFNGWWNAAGDAQWGARPGASATYAVTFGLIGERPTVHYALAFLVVSSAALLLYVVAARFLPRAVSVGLAVLWLILPNHTSLEMWASTINIGLALALTLAGIERATRGEVRAVDDVVAALLFGAAVLSYEAVAPAAILAVSFIALGREPGTRALLVVPTMTTTGLAGAWMVLNWHPDKQGLNATLKPALIFPGHFGETITGSEVGSAVIGGAVLVATAVAGYRLLLRPASSDWRERLLFAGWIVVAVGVLPFVRYFYSPIGFGDRVTVVSGIGSAMVLVSAIVLVARWRVAAGVVLACLVVLFALPQRVSLVSDYATAADDSRRIRAAVKARWPDPPAETIVVGPEPIIERGIVPFYDVGATFQLLYGSTAVSADFTLDEEEFLQAPAEWRIDVRPLARLDDGELGAP
tara:strand:+ start:425 stop:1771 length:1347 start_codon:yes stop_codon:yes gene_type:complete